MHCDDKRTIYSLKQFVLEATSELEDLEKQLKNGSNNARKIEIQNRINYLKKAIQDSKDQLLSMDQSFKKSDKKIDEN
jgi:predicted  nucleic acid-binding Zn-ribbon protein